MNGAAVHCFLVATTQKQFILESLFPAVRATPVHFPLRVTRKYQRGNNTSVFFGEHCSDSVKNASVFGQLVPQTGAGLGEKSLRKMPVVTWYIARSEAREKWLSIFPLSWTLLEPWHSDIIPFRPFPQQSSKIDKSVDVLLLDCPLCLAQSIRTEVMKTTIPWPPWRDVLWAGFRRLSNRRVPVKTQLQMSLFTTPPPMATSSLLKLPASLFVSGYHLIACSDGCYWFDDFDDFQTKGVTFYEATVYSRTSGPPNGPKVS